MALIQRLFVACLYLGFPALGGEGAVHLRGTDALLPMAQYMAETYMRDHPGSTIVVATGGTFRGYKSLLDGTTDVAMVSSKIQENVEELLTKDSPTFHRTIVGYTAIVPVVHPANIVTNLSLSQLRDVFSGHIGNWKLLGGKDARIVTLVGPPTDGLTATWREAVLGPYHSYSPKGVVTASEDRIRRVAADPGAITFVSFGDLTPSVKALTVNGQKPTADKVRDGSYPLSAPLMLISTQGTSPQARRFVDYFSTPNKRLRLQGIITSETRD